MLLEILLFSIFGIFAGTFTGLMPGIHINLVGAIMVGISQRFQEINSLYFVSFITSMAITHTFLDFVPSIFLGCPDNEDTALTALPGHQMLQKGYGFQAVMLANYGNILAITILVIFILPLIFFSKASFPFIEKIIVYLLIAISAFMILNEQNKIKAAKIFFLTGFLGLILFYIPTKQPLLPLLTGLFGASMIITSINSKIKIPKQEISLPKINPIKSIIASTIICPIFSLLPALGTSQTTVLGASIFKMSKREFILFTGIANTLIMGLSFVYLFSIEKTRSGASVAIQQLATNLSPKIFFTIMLIIVFSAIISFGLTALFGVLFSKNIEKINYTKFNQAILIIITLVVFLVSGLLGLLVFAVSTAVGIYVIREEVSKSLMMGSLILPTIYLYLF